MMRHFRGSRAIGFWGHFIFGLERNAQHIDRFVRTVTTFRMIKDRYTGKSTGETFLLGYDSDKGRQYELDETDCAKYEELLHSKDGGGTTDYSEGF